MLRRHLHDLYGGGRQGGIEPSGKTPNVFLFTSPVGNQFGYNFDGWHSDGTFHFTGEGQRGDQVMTHGNRAVRDHKTENRQLRLFEKVGTSVRYIGEFEIPDESHYVLDEAPDVEQTTLRRVIVFRLRAIGEAWELPAMKAPEGEFTEEIAIEASNVESYISHRSSLESSLALRVEGELVKRYVRWLEVHRGATAVRQAIPTAAGHRMYTDIFVKESGELIEAKASSSRTHIRHALGQILDYSRYVEHATLAILVPTEPEIDMVQLLLAHGVGVIWEKRSGVFVSAAVTDAWS